MRWPWEKRPDPRGAREVRIDDEFERTKSDMEAALARLKVAVERIEYKEAAREQRAQRGCA
jgi:hypothetical protein